MKKLALFLLISLPVCAQVIDPRTQINWPRVSGNGSPASAGFAADCGTHYGQPYTDNTGPHQWVCTTSGWFQVDQGGGSSTVIQVNSTPTTPVSPVNLNDTTPVPDTGYVNAKVRQDGSANVSFEVPSTTAPAIQMFPVPPDTNQGIFVPFTACNTTTTNGSLTIAQGCDTKSGFQQSGAGSIFNHNASLSIQWTVPTLPSGVLAANVTAVYVMAWDGVGGSVGHTLSCSATGVGSTIISWSVPNYSQVSQSFSVSGANIPSTQCTMNQSQSVLGDYGLTQMAQIGLWVEYTGSPVSNPNALNVQYPLIYYSKDNSLGVSQFWPDYVFPRLFANLPPSTKFNSSTSGYPVYVVSDNSTTTIGAQCAGTGTVASPYSLCQMDGNGGWLYEGTFGGSGPPAVSSVTNSDGSLTISPTAGAVVASINTSHSNSFHADQSVVNSRFSLVGTTAPFNLNGSDGASGECVLSQGTGNSPRWGTCSGGSGLSGQTVNYLPKATSTSASTTSSALEDQGSALVYHGTGSSHGVSFPASSVAITPAASTAIYESDSSGNGVLSENGAAASRICTASNGQCAGTTPVTTKGDVYTYSTVPARLPVGTDGQVLTADSTQTTGLKWGTGSGGCMTQMQVAGSGQSTITFSSIPQTCTDLELTACISTASGNADIYLIFNSDSTTTNYSRGYNFAGQANTSGFNNTASGAYIGNSGGGINCKTTVVTIPGYTSTVQNKSWRSIGMASSTSGDSQNISIINTAGAWYPTTPAAITRIDINSGLGGSFSTGTTYTLRGK